MSKISLNEFRNIFGYLLNNNKMLEDKGQTPIAICVEGSAGLGKTSVIEDYAKENGMTMCKVNLSQLEEVGDLVGMPIKEYEAKSLTNDITTWYNEQQVKVLPDNMMITGKVRTSYAPPSWLPEEENPNGTIVFLDDFSRANNMFMQATMELINQAKYISWNLPKYTSVVLSSNPDDGSYSVTSLDEAQTSRMITFKVKHDVKDWAKWAEKAGIDGRIINFELMYGDNIFEEKHNTHAANPRSYTTFGRAISNLDDWTKTENLAMILQIADGCFPNDKDNIIGSLFTQFINNKLDKLISPEDMLNLSWDTLQPKLADCVYENGKYRTDIAGVLTIRFINHVDYLFSKKGTASEPIIKRIIEIVEADQVKKLLTVDLIFHMVKTLYTKYPQRCTKLVANAKLRNAIIL